MTQGLGLPGVASNITNIQTQCTPALCDIKLYGVMTYAPSLQGNLIFGALFILFFLLQLIFMCIWRTWSYSLVMIVGLLLEIIGYWARVAMHFNIFNVNLFLINIIALTIGPVFFTAAIYLTLARIIVHYGIHNSNLSPKAYSIIFMLSDFIALVLQSIGGGIADRASTKKVRDLGVKVMVGGLSFQFISLAIFMILATSFFLAVKRDRAQMRSVDLPPSTKGYKGFVWAFAIATFLIFLRSGYRVAELVHGFQSKLANNEVTFIIFETCMIGFALCIMTAYHPGRYTGRGGWKQSGWGKNARILEAKQISPVMGQTNEWTARYGNGQPSNRNYGLNDRDIHSQQPQQPREWPRS